MHTIEVYLKENVVPKFRWDIVGNSEVFILERCLQRGFSLKLKTSVDRSKTTNLQPWDILLQCKHQTSTDLVLNLHMNTVLVHTAIFKIP